MAALCESIRCCFVIKNGRLNIISNSPLTIYQSCREKILPMTGTKEMLCLCGGNINITLKIGSVLVNGRELGLKKTGNIKLSRDYLISLYT